MNYAEHQFRRIGMASAAVLLGLALAGCGGGDEAGRSSAAATSAQAQNTEAAAAAAEKPQLLRKLLRRYVKKGVTAVALSPDGGSVAVARADGKVRLLDANSVLDVSRFDIDIGAVATGVLFSSDGRRLGVVGRDSDVHLFDAGTGKKLL
ncbi:WD40 repeat domain-containing protein, partial [Azohydromonas caseinilytica]